MKTIAKIAKLYKKITDSKAYAVIKTVVIVGTICWNMATNPIAYLDDIYSIDNQCDMILTVQEAEQDERERKAEDSVRASQITKISLDL